MGFFILPKDHHSVPNFPTHSLIHPVNPSPRFYFPQPKEVKEAAISGMATCIASFADSLSAEVPKVSAHLPETACAGNRRTGPTGARLSTESPLIISLLMQFLRLARPTKPQVLQVLLERLRNEVTRLPAVRAMATICASPCAAANLTPVLEPVAQELTGFLRKANRMLKHAALDALEVNRGLEVHLGLRRRFTHDFCAFGLDRHSVSCLLSHQMKIKNDTFC